MLKKLSSGLLSKLAVVYTGLASLALIHLVALLAIAAYAYRSGKIDREKIETIVALIRGEEDGPAEEGTPPDVTLVAEGGAASSAQLITRASEQDAMEQLGRERALADIRNYGILVDRRALKLQKEQEAHQRRVELHQKQLLKRREQELSDTHKKTIETIGSMAPKKARDFLMTTSEADVLAILLALPDRKRRGVLESCRTPAQTMWRDRILSAMLKQPAAGQVRN